MTLPNIHGRLNDNDRGISVTDFTDNYVKYSDFSLTVGYYNTSRQYGKCINIIVNYRYISTNIALDYKPIRQRALYYAEPTQELPIDAQWEYINLAFVNEIMSTYKESIVAMTSQFQVMSQNSSVIDEPGNHGSTITQGDIIPLREPMVNNFLYDCTKFHGFKEYMTTILQESSNY